MLQPILPVDAVEHTLEVVEELEGWFAHHVKDVIACMLGRDFEASAHVVAYKLLVVEPIVPVDRGIAGLMQRQVVSDSAAYKRLPDSGKGVDGMIYVEQGAVVGVEITAWGGVETRGAETFAAYRLILATHSVHIGRRTAKVADIALEVGHGNDALSFGDDALLASR